MAEDSGDVEVVRRALMMRDAGYGEPDHVWEQVGGLLKEHDRLQGLLRGTGANRYWEGRWRDREAEIARLRAELAAANCRADTGDCVMDESPEVPCDEKNCRYVAMQAELAAARQDAERMLRKAIDFTWGYALEDGSVPSTKIQDKIIATVRAALQGTTAPAISSIDFHQRKGRASDIIAEALLAYDQWMLDDNYDATSALRDIMTRMKNRAALQDATAAEEST